MPLKFEPVFLRDSTKWTRTDMHINDRRFASFCRTARLKIYVKTDSSCFFKMKFFLKLVNFFFKKIGHFERSCLKIMISISNWDDHIWHMKLTNFKNNFFQSSSILTLYIPHNDHFLNTPTKWDFLVASLAEWCFFEILRISKKHDSAKEATKKSHFVGGFRKLSLWGMQRVSMEELWKKLFLKLVNFICHIWSSQLEIEIIIFRRDLSKWPIFLKKKLTNFKKNFILKKHEKSGLTYIFNLAVRQKLANLWSFMCMSDLFSLG